VHTGCWYLVAFDHERDDWRTFRVDRIKAPVDRRGRFRPRQPPADGDLRAFVSRSIAVLAYPHRAELVVHAPAATVTSRVSLAAASVERLDAHRCRVSVGALSLTSLALWAASFGVDFEVISPKELLGAIRDVRDRLDAALSRSTGGAG
jgi:predicted DNA-binding transcriptional regulator YafY